VRPTAEAISQYAGKRVFAFAGIARPRKFLRSLRDAGATVVETKWFGDHHRFTEPEMRALEKAAHDAGAALVTTEKDGARIGGRYCVDSLPIEVLFLPGGDAATLLSAALNKARLKA
jgi:tetraacyldisaccharide 4'-kinase